jgi:hypothetical protein
MNYTTALTLPDWATEAQVYSQQVIRFTPIVFKAFKKTLAPVIIDSLKRVGLHLIERERLWKEWALNASGITHNPLQAAVRSAHAELTSTEAQATYRHIRHITRETAMDALVIGLCGVVAVATTIEATQAVYCHAKRIYSNIQARSNPAPAIVPTEVAIAATSGEEIAAIVKEIQAERYFNTQFDRLDSDCLAIVEEEVDEAIAQVMIDQLKTARAALLLAQEGDRLVQEALAYMVDQVLKFASVELPTTSELSVAALQKPTAPAAPKPQRKTKAKVGEGEAKAQPKQARGRAKAKI